MTVPDIIVSAGAVHDLTPPMKYSPYSGNWWVQSNIEDIPESSVGWLVAQGWQITEADTKEEGGQTYFKMSRQSMNSWMILQSCLNEYTQAFNEGRYFNDLRYEDIVNWWGTTIHNSREQLDMAGDVSDGHITLYFAHLDTIIADIEAEATLAKADMVASAAAVTTAIADYVTQADLIDDDYGTHQTTARALLTGLGATELVRINEHFDNVLAQLRQGLVNRGLYSSGLFAQTETRIARERSEAISKLNDMLAREKLTNEHQLYGQKISNRTTILDAKGKQISLLHQQGEFLVGTRMKLALEVMQARMTKAQGRMDVRDREEKLMAYQLDTRNNLLTGLWAFQERREDEYPSLDKMTQLITGLGDASGGWVSPG